MTFDLVCAVGTLEVLCSWTPPAEHHLRWTFLWTHGLEFLPWPSKEHSLLTLAGLVLMRGQTTRLHLKTHSTSATWLLFQVCVNAACTCANVTVIQVGGRSQNKLLLSGSVLACIYSPRPKQSSNTSLLIRVKKKQQSCLCFSSLMLGRLSIRLISGFLHFKHIICLHDCFKVIFEIPKQSRTWSTLMSGYSLVRQCYVFSCFHTRWSHEIFQAFFLPFPTEGALKNADVHSIWFGLMLAFIQTSTPK